MEIGTARVHRIVATAFHSVAPTKEHVVDHIDTNKMNNRPENLRWVTRLENTMLNPITAKRIAIVCGSVEAFFADPLKFRDKFQEPNFKWMQTVSAEEAQICRERLLAWAANDKFPSGSGSLDRWIFRDRHYPSPSEESVTVTVSDTPNAIQMNWKTACEFPCCPQNSTCNPMNTYAENLQIGRTFSTNKYASFIIYEVARSEDGRTLWVISRCSEDNAIKGWALAQITFEDTLFVHTNLGSFFALTEAIKQFKHAQGIDWTGEDSVDSNC
ncbi:HNH endonuclease signature motif containing protein [Chitinophaga sp. S165]|uniref:HNH endonuclease signature motif containing protein n=1 Tax=Chitinophaga sp. S165 TaxID=2135462 RepID=UPI0018EE9155|nr:HNH endonuclease signature motif containing protein [Chitinophaga sp. S165]